MISKQHKTLDIYYLLDTGTQMSGDKIGSINYAMEEVIGVDLPDIVTANDIAIRIVVMQFSNGASWITPPSGPINIGDMIWNDLHAYGANDFGQALNLLAEQLQKAEFSTYLSPIIIAFSNAPVTDDYEKAINQLNRIDLFHDSIRIGIEIGKNADRHALTLFTGTPNSVITVNDTHALKELMRIQQRKTRENQMIDLKTILKQHPNCLNSRSSFKSVLMDTYPAEKRTVNILTIMFECGIIQKIKSKQTLGENDYLALLLQLENDYGITPEYSNESIFIWAKALDVAVQVVNKQTTTPVTHKPIVHALITEKIVVEGSKSDYETKIENGNITITKFIGFDEKEIIVPNQIDGISVKSIGENAFEKCVGIERIVVSEGIREIGNGAFNSCTSLVSIVLPAELNLLGAEAFVGCSKLTQIDLPNGIKEIGKSTFFGCKALKRIIFPDNLVSIGRNAFCNSGVESIDIPPTITKIETCVFRNCVNLSQIKLHEGLVEIENKAFENCKTLCEITIPRSVLSIGKNVFDVDIWCQLHDSGRKGYSTRGKSQDLVIACYAGSYGLDYARQGGYQIKNAAK